MYYEKDSFKKCRFLSVLRDGLALFPCSLSHFEYGLKVTELYLLLLLLFIFSLFKGQSCSLSLWRVARGSKLMRLELIHGLFIT